MTVGVFVDSGGANPTGHPMRRITEESRGIIESRGRVQLPVIICARRSPLNFAGLIGYKLNSPISKPILQNIGVSCVVIMLFCATCAILPEPNKSS